MMILGHNFEIDCAHRLLNDTGLCKFLHGHSYKIEVEIAGDINNDMILHFAEMKKNIKEALSLYDHTALLSRKDDLVLILDRVITFDGDPTVENLTVKLFEILKQMLHNKHNVILYSLRVWEGNNKYCYMKNENC